MLVVGCSIHVDFVAKVLEMRCQTYDSKERQLHDLVFHIIDKLAYSSFYGHLDYNFCHGNCCLELD